MYKLITVTVGVYIIYYIWRADLNMRDCKIVCVRMNDSLNLFL